MKVKLNTIMCGTAGSFGVGDIIDVVNGQDLINGGYAEAIAEEKAEAPAIETADVAPDETEEAPKKKQRPRKGKL